MGRVQAFRRFDPMNLFVTGASGYIGSGLIRQALARGHVVCMATRLRPENAASWLAYDLADRGPFHLPPGTDAVIHLAASLGADPLPPEREFAASERLIAACHGVGAKFLFVSSQAASATAPTAYGRTKWRIEELTKAAGGVVLAAWLATLFHAAIPPPQLGAMGRAGHYDVRVQPLHLATRTLALGSTLVDHVGLPFSCCNYVSARIWLGSF